MKQVLFVLVLLALIAPACHKSSNHNSASRTTTYMNSATITGPNLTVPVCGDNYIIIIHGITDSAAQFNSLPTGSGINLATATFPINVNINWTRDTGNECDTIDHSITITAVSTTP